MTEPSIGIWWDDGRQIVALTHPPDVHSHGEDLIDSELEHWRAWEEEIAGRFDPFLEPDYYDVPRGRVMYRRSTQESIILHGTSTSRRRLELIAYQFQLLNWKSAVDEHYEQINPFLAESGVFDEPAD